MKEKIKFIYLDEHTLEGDSAFPTYGTQLDLKRYGITFEEGKRYWFWHDSGADYKGQDNPVLFTGVAHFNNERDGWFVVIDEGSGQYYSESEFKDDYTIEDIVGPSINEHK